MAASWRTCSSLLGLFFCCVSAFAQVNSASVEGSVQGAVVFPAAITINAVEIGLEVTSNTDKQNHYSFTALPPGTYELRAGTGQRWQFTLHLDEHLHLDLDLRPSSTTTVVVTASAADLTTDQASLGKVITGTEIRNLPLLGRNFQELLLLVPGVAQGAGGNNSNYAVNGQREFANSIVVNGVEVTGNRNNDTNLTPSVDNHEEFKAITSGYSAEFGRSGAGVVAIQTRSGSNALHASGYEFLRTNKTTARSFFSPKPSALKQNNFGGTLGGPIQKDKTFFFAGYEAKRARDTFSYLNTTVPSSMIRMTPAGADLSGLRDPLTGNTIPIFDPQFYATNFYAQQFPGNIIPTTRLSPAGVNVLQTLFPKPNAPGILNGWFNNYQTSQRYQFNSDTGDLRLDHIFSSRQRVSLNYDVTDFRYRTGDPFEGGIPYAGGGGADSADRTATGNHAIGATHVFAVRPDQLNEVRVSLFHTTLSQDTLPTAAPLPQIYLGFGAVTGGSTYKPLTFQDDNITLADHYTWIRGRHNMKFGYEYRRLSAQPNFSLFPTSFQYYSGAYQSLTSDPNYAFYDPNAYYGNGGNEVADLLLGLPTSVNVGRQFTSVHTQSYEHHGFVQDTWRVTSRLTVDLGLRYEFQAPYREADNLQSNFDLATGRMLLASRGGNSSALVRADKNNFAPRIGFALALSRKTTLRSAYGIYYTPENAARSDVLTKNYPFFSQQLLTNSPYSAPVYTLDQGIPRPAAPVIPSGASSVALPDATQSLYYVDPGYRTGYSQSYHLTLQHELPHAILIEAGYVGQLSRKLPIATANINLASRLSKNLGTIRALNSQGNSSYQGLQVNATRRFNKVGFLVSYRFSKTLDNGPAPFNLGRNHQSPQDPFNLAAERAVSSIDVRQNLTASAQWSLPLGLQLNGILSLRSGLPANVIRNGNKTGYEGLRPNVLQDPTLDSSAQTLARYFDTTAFSVKGLAPTALGNAGRNLIRGPGYANLDLSLFKSFQLRERAALQLRLEAFNITNTPHFANPNTDLSQGQFGSITQTIGNPRILQIAAKVNY